MAATDVDEQVIAQYRAGGSPPGMHRERLLLLTTTGRRTGRPRTSPMMFVDHDGRPVVVASGAGATQHPAWFLNAVADPTVTVETPDGRTRQARAEELEGAERERVWTALVADFPFFAEHQERAGDRRIPLLALREA